MEFAKDSVSIFVGNTYVLTAKTFVDDINVGNSTITWSSGNTSVATVNSNGVVTGVSIGDAVIYAKSQYLTATCVVTVKCKGDGSENGVQYVNLGLSVKWATYNVGADKEEDYGDYYAWGDIEPYYDDGYAQESPQAHWKDGKSSGYSWSTYKWCNGSSSSLTKYNTNVECEDPDMKTTLEIADDVANVKWGGNWRMPTKEEQDELRTNCTWTWITLNGVKGYRVTSNKSGYTNRSIFLPAAGYRYGTSLSDAGSSGYYWSSSLNSASPYSAWYIYFYSSSVYASSYHRSDGRSVRPVCP